MRGTEYNCHDSLLAGFIAVSCLLVSQSHLDLTNAAIDAIEKKNKLVFIVKLRKLFVEVRICMQPGVNELACMIHNDDNNHDIKDDDGDDYTDDDHRRYRCRRRRHFHYY